MNRCTRWETSCSRSGSPPDIAEKRLCGKGKMGMGSRGVRREIEVGCTVDVRPRRERRTCSIVHVVTVVYLGEFFFFGYIITSSSFFFFFFFGTRGVVFGYPGNTGGWFTRGSTTRSQPCLLPSQRSHQMQPTRDRWSSRFRRLGSHHCKATLGPFIDGGTVTYTISMSTVLPFRVLVMRTRRPHSLETCEDYDTKVNYTRKHEKEARALTSP